MLTISVQTHIAHSKKRTKPHKSLKFELKIVIYDKKDV